MIEFDDPKLSDSVSRKLGQTPPFADEKVEQISQLIVKGAHSLEGIYRLKNLRRLTLEKSSVKTLSFLRECRELQRLTVRASVLSDMSDVSLLRSCDSYDFVCTRVRDLSPLLNVEAVLFLNVCGTPLSDNSYREILPRLEEDAISVTYDTVDVWRLNRRLDEQGIAAAYSSHSEDEYRLVPLTDELQFSQEKLVYAVISPEELAAELDEPDVDLADLVERYKPEEKIQQSVWDTRERGTADEARAWIAAGELDDELAESLSAFVGRFEEATFVGDSERVIRHYERYTSFKWDKKRLKFRLPTWFRTLRKTLGCVERDGKPACVVVEPVGGLEVGEEHPPAVWSMGPLGARGFAFGAAVVDRHQAFPVAYGGEEAEWVMAINAADAEDRRVFVFQREAVFRWAFDPFEHVAFDTYAGFLDAVCELRTTDDACPSVLVSQEAPTVTYDVDALRHRATSAEEARGWVDESELSEGGKKAMVELIEDFPEATVVRDSAASIEFFEVLNQARMPEWIRQQRQVLAYLEVDGQPTDVQFANFPYAWEGVFGDEWFDLAHPRVPYQRERIVDEHRRWPVARGPHHMLAVGLESTSNGFIRWTDLEELASGDYLKAFGLAGMFETIRAVRTADGRTIERQ